MDSESEYIVVGRTNGTTRLGSPYCSLKVKNNEEEFSLAVWDVAPTDPPAVGQLVSFLRVQESDGKRSARKGDLLPGTVATPEHQLYGLLLRPVAPERWHQTIQHLLSFCTQQPLMQLIKEASEQLLQLYAHYPAAASIHHAYVGGLLTHTYQMLHMFEGLYPCLPYEVNPEYCIVAILFHDYGKVQTYTPDGDTLPASSLLGHIYLSAYALQRELERRAIPVEDIQRIIHVVLAHHGRMDYGSPVLPCNQEAFIVSMLDNISAKTDTLHNASEGEYLSALGTRVVK